MADQPRNSRADGDTRSLGELFRELSQELTTLLRQEVALAKSELREGTSRLTGAVVSLLAGGFVAYAGVLAIIAGIVLLLALFIPHWLSALIVGLVVALIGYAMVQKGINDLKKGLVPKQTIASLKEDREFVKEQLK